MKTQKNYKLKIKFKSIRQKMLFYTFSITFLMAVTTIMNFFILKNTSLKIDNLFEKNLYLQQYSQEINKLDSYLYEYLSTKSSKNLYQFLSLDSKLRLQMEMLNRDIFSQKGNLILNDLINLTNEYLNNSEKAVNAKRSRKTKEYTEKYIISKKILGYINFKLQNLNNIQFKSNTFGYLKLRENLQILIFVDITIIFIVFLISILFDIWYSFEFTKPILKISNNAEKISQGVLSVEDINLNTNDEIEKLSETINNMKHNLNNYIIEIKNNAEKEAEFTKQKLEYLEMKNTLKSAELRALQAQINPHFLFNTLNAGVQLAMFEDAERTGLFLEKLSNIFRYHLKDINKPVTLEEEIKNIRDYIFILKIRFGDFFKFEFQNNNVEFSKTENIKLPLFTLQPLIENAFVHGIKEKEEGGFIKIILNKVKKQNKNYTQIIIEDNGQGMTQQKIEEIFGKKEISSIKGNGIGIRNVIYRLKLFFQKDILSIESKETDGTKIILNIPEIY